MIECISSLLDTFDQLPKKLERGWLLDMESAESGNLLQVCRDLAVKGLRILQKLAANENNYRVISNTQGQLSKMMHYGNSENTECFMFAECIISGTRQTAALPSVSSETLGVLLHSAYLHFAEFQHSATIRHSAYLIFTECQHSASMGHSAITNM